MGYGPPNGTGGSGSGDMEAATYDPQNIADDAFDRDNHTGEQPISSVTNLQTALDAKAVMTLDNDDVLPATIGKSEFYTNNTGDLYHGKVSNTFDQVLKRTNIGGVNAQTGTTYTYLASDFSKIVTHSNASSIAGTLPQAGTTGFASGWYTTVRNIGAGTVTITPTTSTINGVASLLLRTRQAAILFSDGTNYSAVRVDAPAYACTASGTDTYTGTVDASFASWITGQEFTVTFTNANTGAATFNPNSVGAKSIVKNGSTALSSGDIPAGSVKRLYYDGTNLQIVGDGGGAVSSIVGITGTKSEFNTAVTDGNFLYDGDVTLPYYAPVATGDYFNPQRITTTGTGNPTTQRVYYSPIYIGASTTVDRVGVVLTATTAPGGSTVEIGLYADSSGRPGSRIDTYGTAAVDSGTNIEITISKTLSPGLYWIAVLFVFASGSITCRLNSVAAVRPGMDTLAKAVTGSDPAWAQNSQTTLPSSASVTATNATCPAVGFRKA